MFIRKSTTNFNWFDNIIREKYGVAKKIPIFALDNGVTLLFACVNNRESG